MPLGFFVGVTTNPVLLQRAGVECTMPKIAELYQEAVKLGMQEVMFQAWGEDVDSLVASAKDIFGLGASNVIVVKLPLTVAGVEAATRLKTESPDHKLCMTTCYSAQQGVVAAGIDAEYIAPYLGRISELEGATAGDWTLGLEECARLQKVVRNLTTKTRVLVASVRKPEQVTELCVRGCDTFTLSPAIVDGLLDVRATYAAAKEFEQAAQRTAEE